MSGSTSGADQSGFSMIGLLITMACIAVLLSIYMTSVNKAVTGAGSQEPGTVRSFEDQLYLDALFKGMFVAASEGNTPYLVPSQASGSNDVSQNTTANLFSAMVMQNYTPAKQLVGGNEYSPYVWPDEDYNFTAYDPARKVFWDPTFKADLQKESNVSFAHTPLFGDRYTKHWRASLDSTFPILGNRGPKDGVNALTSWACGKNGIWGGHLVFGDGHIVFVDNATPNQVVYEQQGKRYADNLFKIDAGPNGGDAILGFTKSMSKKGPELQFD